MIRNGDAESLSEFAQEIEDCEMDLTQLGCHSEIDNSGTLRDIVKRLPCQMRTKWAEVAHKILLRGAQVAYSDLCDFILGRADIAASGIMHGQQMQEEMRARKSIHAQPAAALTALL